MSYENKGATLNTMFVHERFYYSFGTKCCGSAPHKWEKLQLIVEQSSVLMIKVRLFLSSCFSKLSSCAFACFAYFICSSRECLWLMFFSQAQKEFTPSGCGGFFGGYRFIKTVSCFVACNHPIQMTEYILCFYCCFSFLNHEVHRFSAASKLHFQSHWTSWK